jgi:hypothetical protein
MQRPCLAIPMALALAACGGQPDMATAEPLGVVTATAASAPASGRGETAPAPMPLLCGATRSRPTPEDRALARSFSDELAEPPPHVTGSGVPDLPPLSGDLS